MKSLAFIIALVSTACTSSSTIGTLNHIRVPDAGNCENPGPVGTWEDVTPSFVYQHQTYTGALVPLVNPLNPSVMYLCSDSDGIFKSTDCGANWIKVNTGRNGAQIDTGRIWSAAIDPTDGETLYAVEGYGANGLWKSTDGGIDWDETLGNGTEVALVAGGFISRVVIDPTDHLHLVISFHINCAAPHAPVCLGETTDGGTTWQVHDIPVTLAQGAGTSGGIAIISPAEWLYQDQQLYRTTDHGTTWATVPGTGGTTPCLNGNTSTPTRIPDGGYFLGAEPGVITSNDNGTTWSVIPNSGHAICPVTGDGERLFAASGGPSDVRIWAAAYSNPTDWFMLSTEGLSPPTVDNGTVYCFANDTSHHLLYMTLQQAGLWRMVTR